MDTKSENYWRSILSTDEGKELVERMDVFLDKLKEKNKDRKFIPIQQQTICPICGIKIEPVMGYVCPNLNCPIFFNVQC